MRFEVQGEGLFVSLDEVSAIVTNLFESYQLEANQAIRKDDLKQGWAALAKQEACENFFYACKLRAGTYSPVTAEARGKLKRNAKQRTPSRVMQMRKAGA